MIHSLGLSPSEPSVPGAFGDDDMQVLITPNLDDIDPLVVDDPWAPMDTDEPESSNYPANTQTDAGPSSPRDSKEISVCYSCYSSYPYLH